MLTPPTGHGYAMDRLLIPVDGSPRSWDAVEAALALAATPVQVTLLHVIDAWGLGGEESLATIEALAHNVRTGCPGAEVTTRVVSGDPVEEILAAADQVKPGVIVMATREFLPPTVDATGTICARVAAHTQVPVMVCRRQGGWPLAEKPGRIVVPLDGSIRSRQALPIAAGVAALHECPIHLVTVIDPAASLPPAYAYSCETCDGDLQDALISLQGQANGMLDEAERALRRAGVAVSSELLLGKVADCLLGAIQAGDVIVMTTRGESRHASPHLGRIAARLLREAPVPVIVFHPELEATVARSPLGTDWESALTPHRLASR